MPVPNSPTLDLLGALQKSVDRARSDRRQREARTCTARTSCVKEAQPEHSPCCSSHGRDMCCEHYCRTHFIEIDQCSPETHAAVAR